jgi:hypothetical protein
MIARKIVVMDGRMRAAAQDEGPKMGRSSFSCHFLEISMEYRRIPIPDGSTSKQEWKFKATFLDQYKYILPSNQSVENSSTLADFCSLVTMPPGAEQLEMGLLHRESVRADDVHLGLIRKE